MTKIERKPMCGHLLSKAGLCLVVLALHLCASGIQAVDVGTRGSDAESSEVSAPTAKTQDESIPGGLEGGVDWINTAGPIHLQDLRGKIVLLDFWTYCCINCHHVLPDLEFLEQKYPNELVVIGVHTAKFDAEKVTDNIRKKVAEYRIKHPVINDANQTLWNRFGVSSWPTIVLIDAAGNYVGAAPGEGNRELLDQVISKKIAEAREKKILNTEPIRFFPESEKPHQGPLLYPGKILADAEHKRLFITDTGHNRVVVTTVEGRHLATIGNGGTGLTDGNYETAQFNRPQGLCLFQGKLYVADVENHAIREIDLEAQQVKTVAGKGRQEYRRAGSANATEIGLNSPWDLAPMGPNKLAVAMAGPHQIWQLDLDKGIISVWAGTGKEDIEDGSLSKSAFAQPSGLASDGKHLFVADSEGSAIRAIYLEKSPRVVTLAGTHDLPQGMSLFAFGDKDALGNTARLQHCLGLTVIDGKVYVADSYNNKIKEISLVQDDKGENFEPKRCDVVTFVGTRAAGSTDEPAQFDEPGGISAAGDLLFVADTNNHSIRVVERATKKVRTLELEGVKAPEPPRSRPRFPRAFVAKLAAVKLAPTKELTLAVNIQLPEGFALSEEAPMPFLVETPENPQAIDPKDGLTEGQELQPPRSQFQVKVPLSSLPKDGETLDLRLSVSSFECKKVGAGLCRPRNYVWEIPIQFAAGGGTSIDLDTAQAAPVGEAVEKP